ncbi:rhodanese-like domain-containing protein [Asticcacaulis sp. BYS171W]|uniref:Rhodanese-like domain-containing protein n=1 Tax=Asticcacaulis aquaticus TaxID=2984212 RepID=A0ABT5HXZ6_9CAUL|nr:rhodanese-like domain-containing protein [Asticcacaulis aquaticus]MDC7684928.1 rhodanese-like domain-containing protein [Asticcacaulis aquaticus]
MSKTIRLFLGPLIILVAGLTVASVQAAPSPEVIAACQPGTDAQPQPTNPDYPGGLSQKSGGLTPLKLDGAITVSAAEAFCIMGTIGPDKVFVMSGISGDRQIPFFTDLSEAASGDDDPALQKWFADGVAEATKGNKNTPIITYCHHAQCFLSYNIALRLVRAGYTQVYWLRPGIDGWVSAGYPLAAPQAAIEAFNRCGLSPVGAGDYAATVRATESLAAETTDWSQSVKIAQDKRRTCLADVLKTYGKYYMVKETVDPQLAETDRAVSDLYTAAKAEFDKNPNLNLEKSISDTASARKTIAEAGSVKSLTQQCGTFDYTLPPVDNAIIKARDQARRSYATCVENWGNLPMLINTYDFDIQVKWFRNVQRYTCRVRSAPNCLSNDSYDRMAVILTPANIEKVKTAYDIDAMRIRTANAEIDRSNKWLADVNAMVDAYNANR